METGPAMSRAMRVPVMPLTCSFATTSIELLMHLLDSRYAIDRDDALRFAATRGFGLLTAFDGQRPIGVHVPFFLAPSDTQTIVELHVAKANPLACLADGRQHLLVVTGADAYVSNDWYVGADQVSTWLYEAVHLTGAALRQPRSANRRHGDMLLQTFERRLAPKPAWSLERMEAGKREAMLDAIVVIRMIVEAVEGQRKWDQNKSEADRASVACALGEPDRRLGRSAPRDVRCDEEDDRC
jgi:transcriptional regulator